jgi:hypothetical protein
MGGGFSIVVSSATNWPGRQISPSGSAASCKRHLDPFAIEGKPNARAVRDRQPVDKTTTDVRASLTVQRRRPS